ncbi:hypothetical protein POSPLADRAFT_1050487 [Postia placenta MAD-698-R-SB12]|uniref:Uncharacterized protein n=1 Tax=Postia placenta MAD-698-R-SB12 TaxID=670580 RepID=A0A1X6MK93_9APHY|nr:hypothetical protein POSPLADRAFT_1050487 [Postia placenta MAD-698-R-SB12]OSX56847.1 hypothetical protein POSPLADRAFT_1050487 [Postia placenta MAD-698-R-SB12]
MYTFGAVLMPAYCYERLQHVIGDLRERLAQNPPRLPSWLYVAPSSIAAIVAALEYWASGAKPALTATRLYDAHDYTDPHAVHGGLQALENMNMRPGSADPRELFRNMLSAFTDEQVVNAPFMPPELSVAEARAFVRQYQEPIVEVMMAGQKRTDQPSVEQIMYRAMHTFLPPDEYLGHHPDVERAVRRLKAGKDLSSALQQKASDIERRFVFSSHFCVQLERHVKCDFRKNVTFLDDEYVEHPLWNRTGVPQFHLAPFESYEHFADFSRDCGLSGGGAAGEDGRRVYQMASVFFDGVANALKTVQEHVVLEFVAGNLTQVLMKMRYDADETRPSGFPKLYTRAWLSNVPDYTHGTMDIALYMAPQLQQQPEAAVACNCLLNSGAWKDDEEFCHNYTFLKLADVPRYLGCRVVSKEAVMAVLAIGSLPLPRPLSELASRQELTTWLTRVLLAELVSGRSKEPPFKIRMPHGLVAFFALLLHLYRVGYPGHWLSDFLNSVPFSVGVPPNWARSASDLCVLEAKVRPARIFSTRWEDPSPPFAPVVNVLFYDPQVFSPGAKSLILSIPDILEGRKDPPPGSVYILTSVESLDYLIHVRWRMSRQRYAHMKAERWVMVLYRKDTYEQVSGSVPASRWEQLADAVV